jgi:3-oxoacyl-[acyl-carrier-protein] synthase III
MTALENRVRAYLAAAGTTVRYCLADNEAPIDFAVRAGRSALEAAGLTPSQVDVLIYAGVARGWIEPSTASAVQAALGLPRATGFDVGDACAGWLRAMELTQALLRGNRYRCGLIVNAECGLYRNYFDAELESPINLERQLASYTLGEAATATLITNEAPAGEIYFRFRGLPEHHRLCMVPLPNAADFLLATTEYPLTPYRFFAESGQLLRTATKAVIDEFKSDEHLQDQSYDIVFGHSASEKVEQIIADRLGLTSAYCSMHPLYGNTGSASIPLAMSIALDEGRLRRGHRVLAVIASAGISIGFASFTF